MSRTYRFVMGGCAFISAAVVLMYIAVGTISLGDGAGSGIEMPSEVHILSGVVMVMCGTVAADAWFAQRAIREILDQRLPELAGMVASQVGARTAAVIREVIAAEISDMQETAIRKAYRAGQISQAQVNGAPAAKVVKIRLREELD